MRYGFLGLCGQRGGEPGQLSPVHSAPARLGGRGGEAPGVGPTPQRVIADPEQSGRLTDLATGKTAIADDVAKAADGKLFVFLGEEHATEPDQLMHAEIIQALVRRGRHVVVGLEMYQRPKQPILDQWPAGQIEEAEFLKQSDWKGQWGYDFAFYRPVFDAVRRYKLPLVGLNVPPPPASPA